MRKFFEIIVELWLDYVSPLIYWPKFRILLRYVKWQDKIYRNNKNRSILIL